MNFTRRFKLDSKRGETMDFEHVQQNLRSNGLGKKVTEIVLKGCLFLVIAFVILIVAAVILAFNFHTQIYDGFTRSINFIFGDSPGNVISSYIKQFSDNFLK